MRAQAWGRGAVARLMTPFNCPTAHASSPHLLLPRLLLLRSSSSYYSLLLPSRHRRQFASDSSPASVDSTGQNSHTFMEVVREVFKHSSAHGARAAIRADQKSYGFVQLMSSALDVHNILCRKNDGDDSSIKGINGTGFLCGARIGIVAKPSAEFVAGIFGTWLSGGVAVPLALSYPEVELLHVMNDSDISMVLSTKEHHEIMESISTKCSTRYSLLPAVESIPLKIDPQEPLSSELTSSVSSLIAEIDSLKNIKGDDPALILYTSGTTGKPKGVVHTHKGILSQVQILTEAWGYQSEDQFLHCLPLHHVHGLFNALLAPLYSGSVVEFLPKFSVRGVWQRWCESYPSGGASKSDEAITVFTGVPTVYTRLLQGYDSMNPDQQSACSYAAKQLRLMVVIVDMTLAFVFGFLPFSLGRIILGWSSSYTSTTSTLLIGYESIFAVGVSFAGIHTLGRYLKGEQLVIALFIRRLSGMFFRGIVYLITVANIGFNLLNLMILRPLFFGWLLDICTSKMFGATMSQRFRLLIASSLSSTALHWLLGRTFLNLRPRLTRFLRKVLRLGVTISFSSVHHNVYEPFYKFYSKKLLCFLVDTIFVVLVIVVPIEVTGRLSPEVFPLDITYFDHPGKGTSVWQGARNYAVSLSAVLHMNFLIGNTIVYLERLVERAIGYWFVTSGQAIGNNVEPKDQNVSSDEANEKRTHLAIRTMLRVVLAWLIAVIFNSAMLFYPISVWRALLFAIPQLPVAGGLKSNDLFGIAVGFFIISTVVGTSRDIFACMASRGPWLVDLKRHLLVFLWMVIAPYLMGLLVDLSLISPFIGPDDSFPVLDFFCTWSLGWQVKNLWMNLARSTAAAPFLAYFIDERWHGKLTRARVDWSSGAISLCWFIQEIYFPIAMKLLAALGLPYLLAEGFFPRLGYPAAVNSAVYRFAWLGCVSCCVVFYLGKVLCVKIHDSIRDDRYIIGESLQDVTETVAEDPKQ